MNKRDAQLTIQQTKRVYDAIAQSWAATHKELWEDLLPLKKYTKDGDTVLDLGCGSGRLYQLFLGLSIRYVGADQSREQLKFARKRYPRGKFVYGEMTNLSFKDQTFDVIYCIAAFHHLPDKKTRVQALKEMKRVLKPGGRVVMTNWHLWGKWGREKVKEGKYSTARGNNFLIPWRDEKRNITVQRFYHGFTRGELRALFREAGFRVEKQYISKGYSKNDAVVKENIVSVARSRRTPMSRASLPMNIPE